MTLKPSYSVVIPVYNSVATLPEIAERIAAVFRHLGESFEIIMVDDGSRNKETWPTMQSLAEKDLGVVAIQLTRNFGKAGALICGLERARGEWVVTMDDDLQHAPEDIPLLLAEKHHDVVMGSFKQRKHSPLVQLSSGIKAWFDAQLLHKPEGVSNSPFKLLRAHVVNGMLAVKSSRPFIAALVFFVTRDVAMVEVSHAARAEGKSSFNFIRRVRQFSNLLIGNSAFLLQVIAGFGLFTAVASFLAGIILVIAAFAGERSFPGWTSLMVVTVIMGGMILFSIGVIGEYLIRIINGTEARPAYFVRKVISSAEPGE